MRTAIRKFGLSAAVFGGLFAMAAAPAQAAWKPTRNIEFIVPAGIGGGAGQMAQLIQGIIQKHKLMPISMVVISKKGGSGAEGFLYIKNHKNDPHKIIITLSNLFTTPLATGSPFSWKDFTPDRHDGARRVRVLGELQDALQDAARISRRGQEGAAASSRWAAPAPSRKTRSSPPRSSRRPASSSPTCPIKGGGTVATQLVGGHIDSIGQQPDRAGGALARRQHASALRVRRQAHALQRPRSPRPCPGTTSRPASRRGSTSNT